LASLLMRSWRSSRVALVDAPGAGIADDKKVYSYIPEIIRFFLDEQSIRNVSARVGELDAIVTNAAISGRGPLESYPLDRLRATFETNTVGPLRLLRQVLPQWRSRGSGVVVIVSSVQDRVVIIEPGYIAPGMKPADDVSGDDAVTVLAARAQLDDAALESAMRQTPGTTW
jgi:hypothetical protein